MAYKDRDQQRAYQAGWVTKCRRDWLAAQRCVGCGAREGLRVFREPGSPKLRWSKRGPSHSQLTVRCRDAEMCLGRREPTLRPKAKKKEPSRLAVDMAKPDRRAVCAVHGPRDRVQVNDQWRFVCCGRAVSG